MFKKAILSILILLVFSCNSGDVAFYNNYGREDLSRLPLIKPYELINPMTEDSRHLVESWELKLKNEYEVKREIIYDFVNVTLINIQDSIIYGHGRDKLENPNYYFIINTKNDQELVFEEEIPWKEKLKELKCKHDVLYDIWTIYSEFKKNNKLPWPRPL